MRRFGSVSDPPADLLLEGVRVVDPAAGRDEVTDLAVVGGRVAAAGEPARDARRIPAHGLVASPGLCDLHTHLREPGNETAETVASGTRAAARGGFTTVCAMPNTDPALDESARVRLALGAAAGAACRVRVVAAATAATAGEQLTDYAELTGLGAVAFSDDGSSIPSAAVMRHALQYAAAAGALIVQHAEDRGLAAGTAMRAGSTSLRLGLPGWPASAEATVVARDIALAEETGAPLHVTHLSTRAALELVRAAKARGVHVTCDVTPHHLAFADTWVAGDRRYAWEDPGPLEIDAARAYDGSTRVNPPLATREDARALLEGVADGTVDAIATDHAPHTIQDKLVEFGAAAPGISGLETALSICLAAVATGRVGLADILAALSTRPAALIGEERSLAPGAVADLVVFDPQRTWRVDESTLESKGKNTPLLGMELPGSVLLTVAAGRVTYDAIG